MTLTKSNGYNFNPKLYYISSKQLFLNIFNYNSQEISDLKSASRPNPTLLGIQKSLTSWKGIFYNLSRFF